MGDVMQHWSNLQPWTQVWSQVAIRMTSPVSLHYTVAAGSYGWALNLGYNWGQTEQLVAHHVAWQLREMFLGALCRAIAGNIVSIIINMLPKEIVAICTDGFVSPHNRHIGHITTLGNHESCIDACHVFLLSNGRLQHVWRSVNASQNRRGMLQDTGQRCKDT